MALLEKHFLSPWEVIRGQSEVIHSVQVPPSLPSCYHCQMTGTPACICNAIFNTSDTHLSLMSIAICSCEILIDSNWSKGRNPAIAEVPLAFSSLYTDFSMVPTVPFRKNNWVFDRKRLHWYQISTVKLFVSAFPLDHLTLKWKLSWIPLFLPHPTITPLVVPGFHFHQDIYSRESCSMRRWGVLAFMLILILWWSFGFRVCFIYAGRNGRHSR